MKRIRQEYRILFWYASGMIPAALLMNRLIQSGVVNDRLLLEMLQKGWKQTAEGATWAVWRIVLIRLAELAGIIVLCQSRLRTAAVRLLPCFWGVSTSVRMVLLTWSKGAAGLFCFLFSILPHGIAYAVLCLLLLFRYSCHCEVRRGRFWSASVSLAALGILLEIYVNPFLLKLCLIL